MKRIQRNFLFFLFFSLMLTACNEKEEEEDTEEKIACLTITEATGSGASECRRSNAGWPRTATGTGCFGLPDSAGSCGRNAVVSGDVRTSSDG